MVFFYLIIKSFLNLVPVRQTGMINCKTESGLPEKTPFKNKVLINFTSVW